MYYYLASPYSHPEARVLVQRYTAAMDCTQQLLKKGYWVYSPIVHCHEMARIFKLPTDYGFWREYNQQMISPSLGITVLKLAGWKESRGVMDEIQYAKDLGKHINEINWVESEQTYLLSPWSD